MLSLAEHNPVRSYQTSCSCALHCWLILLFCSFLSSPVSMDSQKKKSSKTSTKNFIFLLRGCCQPLFLSPWNTLVCDPYTRVPYCRSVILTNRTRKLVLIHDNHQICQPHSGLTSCPNSWHTYTYICVYVCVCIIYIYIRICIIYLVSYTYNPLCNIDIINYFFLAEGSTLESCIIFSS